MFGIGEFKQTNVYQEAKDGGKLETKLESITRLLTMGLSVEQVA